MREQLSVPDPGDSKKEYRRAYERPTQAWSCGKPGAPCGRGPLAGGRCPGFECQPCKQKDEKGNLIFFCNRTKLRGGPCQSGPLPDGKCLRRFPVCSPVLALRTRRGLFARFIFGATAAALCLLLCGPWSQRFINPGELSASHSGTAFGRQVTLDGSNPDGCSGCHGAARNGLSAWIQAAFRAQPGPLQIDKLASMAPANMADLDGACLECHNRRDLHEPNIDRNISCSVCHREHAGPGPIKPVDAANCVKCHADSGVLADAAIRGHTLEARLFDRPLGGSLLVFGVPRPPEGYTHPIHSFATDHPEFRLSAEKRTDPNTLRFNHEYHLKKKVGLLNGKKLDCDSCHKPDASGAFHQKISYKENCQACHPLQFDAENPRLTLPHGNAGHVRAFLRSLPTQYANYAITNGLVLQASIDDFVQTQLRKLRQQLGAHEQEGAGEILEEQVFRNTNRTGPAIGPGRAADGRALFYGCVYCHDVTSTGESQITPTHIPDRWLTHGRFDHGRHATLRLPNQKPLACSFCHDATWSHQTADVIMPSKAKCTICHSHDGGAPQTCTTCHQYHRTEPKLPSLAVQR